MSSSSSGYLNPPSPQCGTSPQCGRYRRARSCSTTPPSPAPLASRTTSSPVLLRKLRGSVGDMFVMEHNNNVWLAGGEEKQYHLQLSGVNFEDISEDTLKKSKVWLKFSAKQDKKTTELLKNFHKERQIILKRQQVQMDKLLKDNAADRTLQLKNRANNPWRDENPDHASSDTRLQEPTQVLDEKYKKSVEILVMYHSIETIRVDKIHKTEKFDHDKKMLKENHEYFKKLNKEAQEAQLLSYGHYQSTEVLQLTKSIEGTQTDRIASLAADTTLSKEDLARKAREMEEKCDKEIMVKRKQLANTQEIRREQLVAEHNDQIRSFDQLYLRTLKEFELGVQDELEQLEHRLREIQTRMPEMRL